MTVEVCLSARNYICNLEFRHVITVDISFFQRAYAKESEVENILNTSIAFTTSWQTKSKLSAEFYKGDILSIRRMMQL